MGYRGNVVKKKASPKSKLRPVSVCVIVRETGEQQQRRVQEEAVVAGKQSFGTKLPSWTDCSPSYVLSPHIVFFASAFDSQNKRLALTSHLTRSSFPKFTAIITKCFISVFQFDRTISESEHKLLTEFPEKWWWAAHRRCPHQRWCIRQWIHRLPSWCSSTTTTTTWHQPNRAVRQTSGPSSLLSPVLRPEARPRSASSSTAWATCCHRPHRPRWPGATLASATESNRSTWALPFSANTSRLHSARPAQPATAAVRPAEVAAAKAARSAKSTLCAVLSSTSAACKKCSTRTGVVTRPHPLRPAPALRPKTCHHPLTCSRRASPSVSTTSLPSARHYHLQTTATPHHQHLRATAPSTPTTPPRPSGAAAVATTTTTTTWESVSPTISTTSTMPQTSPRKPSSHPTKTNYSMPFLGGSKVNRSHR